MSLLDDVSIVVTPNGYKAGELYAVVPVPTEGAEEVSDGDFLLTGTQAQNTTGTYWTTGTGITISGGSAHFTGNSNADIRQANGVVVGTRYRATFTISNYVSGDIDINVGGNTRQGSYAANGNYTVDIVCFGGNSLYFQEDSSGGGVGFTGSISNISVKEYTSADMDVTRATAATRVDEDGLVNYAEVLGDEEITNGDFAISGTPSTDTWTLGWYSANNASITNGTLILANSATETSSRVKGTDGVSSLNVLTTSKYYRLQYDVVANNGVTVLNYYVGGTGYNAPFTVGTHIIYFESGSDTTFQFRNRTTNSNIVFDNVSVKEVTRDNVPRIDYTGGGCPNILAEPMRTNLVPESEDFSAWTSSNSTLANSTTVVNPSGESSSGLFSVTSGSSNKFSYISVTTTSNLHSYSIFVKYSDVQFIQLAGGGNGSYANFDVQNGVLGNTNANSSIESFGNGWYKCIMTSTSSETFSNTAVVIIDALTSARLSSTSEVGSVYIWGAQLEVGSYATSYIPTSGSTVTRNQDQFTRDGIGSLINSTEGVLFVEMASFVKINPSGNITLTDGSGDNRIYIYYLVDNSISVIYNINSTGAAIHNFALADITQQTKIAVKWGNSNVSVWINGSSVLSAATSNFLPNTLNQLSFSKPSGSVPFEGKVKQLQVYDTALTDTQLAALTS